jgi:hypothetical protein
MDDMDETVAIRPDQYRNVIAEQYLYASSEIFSGIQTQQGKNDFHFLVTLRSFIEYTRRGVWFLVWATDQDLLNAGKATFQRPKSPHLIKIDTLINEAIGEGKISHLEKKLPGINEPLLDCLHALTHGNPISARMLTIGLDKIFDTGGLLARAEIDLGIFRILLYRHMLGQTFESTWKILQPIHNRPLDMKENVVLAARQLKTSGKIDSLLKSVEAQNDTHSS